MAWIKRNLVILLTSVVSLALLGGAGFFLYTKYEANREITEELNSNIANLKNLANRNPHPGTDEVDNISAAKNEAENLEEFLGEVKQFFPEQITEPLDSRQFRAMLDTAISGLQNTADAYGVKLPEDYWFTFAAQKSAIQFDKDTLQTLATQLIEINELCKVLYDAKVVALDSVRRVPVAEEDSGWQDYLSEETGETNQWAVVMPYEVTFQGFSPEIARVFEGLIRTKGACFVVKNVGINRADAEPVQPGYGGMSMGGREGGVNRYGGSMRGPMGGMGSSRGRGGMSPDLLSRYGLAGGQPARPAAQPNLRGSLLDEKMLKVTLTIDSVRLKAGGQDDMGLPPDDMQSSEEQMGLPPGL